MKNILEVLTTLDEDVTKHYPELQYEGVIHADEDELDYVNIAMEGVVIA